MDVTCERCSTEYEFDETLVSERGTTVKCTNCGHLFKVFRATSEGERPWILKRQSGSTEALRSLRELQQRIAKGKVSENDSISRSGEAWKRLGDIAELKTFFQAAEAGLASTSLASKAPQPSKNTRKATLFGLGQGVPSSAPSRPAPPLPGPRSQPAPAPRPPAPRPAAPRPAAPAAPRPAAPRPAPPKPRSIPVPPPKPKSVPAPPPRPKPTPPRPVPSPPSRPTPARAALKGAPALQPAGKARAPRLAEPTEKIPHQSRKGDSASPQQKGRPLLWAFLILLVAGGVAVAILWDQVSPLLGLEPENPAQAFIDAGDDALANAHVDGYASAVRAYTQATAVAPDDPAVLTALGRSEAAWAQALAFQVSDLEARARQAESAVPEEDTEEDTEEDSDETGLAERTAAASAFRQQATPIEQEQRRHARAASESAAAALDIQANGPAEVVAANAARLLGENDMAVRHLDRAGEMFQQPNADFHLAKALQAGAEGMGEALQEARAALAANENFIEARLVIARALIARGNPEGARSELEAVLAAVADHPRATALLHSLQEVPPNAEAINDEEEAARLAGATDETDETDEATSPTTPPTTPPTSASGARDHSNRRPTVDDDAPPPEGREYSWYNREGDSAMDRGATGRAREYYQMALEQRPGASEALTGLGYVELERGRASSAIRYFQQARRNQYGDAFIGLGDALRRLGRNAEAVSVYEDYLESRPNGPQASVARRQIQALRPQTESGENSETSGSETGASETGASETGASETGASETGASESDPSPTPAETPEAEAEPTSEVPAADSTPETETP